MKAYIMSVIATAILCAIIKAFVGEKSATGKIISLLCGTVIAIAVVKPIDDIKFYNIPSYLHTLSADADRYIQDGANAAEKSISNIIKTQTEAYILDKAVRMGLDISVEVELDDQSGNVPVGVRITGKLSPYAKEVLSSYIQDDLGIAKEMQRWN